MRPQFSLLSMLLLVPYAAIVAAAATDIFSVWAAFAFYALPIFFLIACAVAVFARGNRRVFAFGMVVGCLLYAVFVVISMPIPWVAPHDWIAARLPVPPASLEFHEDYDEYDLDVYLTKLVFAASQCTLAAGAISGFIAVALWPSIKKLAERFDS